MPITAGRADQLLFDAVCDDVYQNETHVLTMGGQHPLCLADLKVSLGMATVFGPHLAIPGRFLIDHSPLIDLCLSEWGPLALKVLRPAIREADWDEFLDNCGGTAMHEPVYMSSHNETRNAFVLEPWKKNRDYRESRARFRQSFPNAVNIVERLKTAQVSPMRLRPAKPFSDFLTSRLAGVAVDEAIRQRLTSASNRGSAFRVVKQMEQDKVIEDRQRRQLMRAAIAAKQDEVREQLGVSRAAEPVVRASQYDRPGIALDMSSEFPALGSVLAGVVAPSALDEILNDTKMAKLRGDWVRINASGDVAAAFQQLRMLCEQGAAILGMKQHEGLVNVSKGLGPGAAYIGAKMLIEGVHIPLACAFLFAGGVMLLASQMPTAYPLWTKLHYDWNVASELLAYGERLDDST